MALAETIQIILQASMIFLFASLGEVFDERSGVLNIGLEGMMLVGALTSIIVSETTANPWIGVLAGMAAAGFLAFAHGIMAVSLKVSQVVSGTGVWLFGLGITTYFGAKFIGPVQNTIDITIAGFTPLFYIGLLLVPILWFVIFKTSFGLRVRTVGEDPAVAEAAGINVIRTRHICVVTGGLLAGLSGAYLALVYTGVWSEHLTLGRGWIALAIVAFSFWRPFLTLAGSIGFGALWVAALKLQGQIPYLSTNLLKLLPYLLTAIVLVIMSLERFRTKIGPPAALTKPYFPEE